MKTMVVCLRVDDAVADELDRRIRAGEVTGLELTRAAGGIDKVSVIPVQAERVPGYSLSADTRRLLDAGVVRMSDADPVLAELLRDTADGSLPVPSAFCDLQRQQITVDVVLDVDKITKQTAERMASIQERLLTATKVKIEELLGDRVSGVYVAGEQSRPRAASDRMPAWLERDENGDVKE